MRVGIFGGAFDPPHLGHEKALKALIEAACLDLVYVFPSGDPPHKIISGGALSSDRLAMAKLAFSKLSDAVCVSDREMVRQGVSYSYLTLAEVKREHPDAEIYLFVGTDQFLLFETWKNFEQILEGCTLCVMDRFEDSEGILKKKEVLEQNFGARLLLLKEKPYIISSTRIREELAEKGFSSSLSPKVNGYITLRGIYSALSDPDRKRLIEEGKKELSAKRFSHTLAVERCVDGLCRIFSLSPKERKELCLAALYHDRTKEWPQARQEEFLIAHGGNPEILAYPSVVHAVTAAYLAADEGLLSQKAIDAVFCHTTGKSGMTLFDKILYFADFIEETRSHEACQRMRARFFDCLPETKEERLLHLDACILEVMEGVEEHVTRQGNKICPMGHEALLDMKKQVERTKHDIT